MVNEEYNLIPAQIRSMSRLWANQPGMEGLVIRRNLEAALFEKGLKAA
jgi:GH24 family phage-related lysozyme (muramidase)